MLSGGCTSPQLCAPHAVNAIPMFHTTSVMDAVTSITLVTFVIVCVIDVVYFTSVIVSSDRNALTICFSISRSFFLPGQNLLFAFI